MLRICRYRFFVECSFGRLVGIFVDVRESGAPYARLIAHRRSKHLANILTLYHTVCIGISSANVAIGLPPTIGNGSSRARVSGVNVFGCSVVA